MGIKVMRVGRSEEESKINHEQEDLVTESPVNKVASESESEVEDVVEVKKELKIKCPYCGSGLTITSETVSCSECNEEIASELVSSLFKRSEELAREREATLAESQKVTSASSFDTDDNTEYFKKKDAFSGGKSKTINLGGTKSPTIIRKSPTISNQKPVTTNKGLVIHASNPKVSNNKGLTVKSNYSGNTEKRKTPWVAIVIGGFILVIVGGMILSYYLFVSQFSNILSTVGERTSEDSYGSTYGGVYTGNGSYIQDVPFETVVEDYYVPTESEKEDLKNALVSNATTYSLCDVTPLLDPMNPGVIYFNIDSSSVLGQRVTKLLDEPDSLKRSALDPNIKYDISAIVAVTNNKLEVPFDVLYMFILDEDPSKVLYSNYGGYDVINVFAE